MPGAIRSAARTSRNSALRMLVAIHARVLGTRRVGHSASNPCSDTWFNETSSAVRQPPASARTEPVTDRV